MSASETFNIALSGCLAYSRLTAPLAALLRHHPSVSLRLQEQCLLDQHRGLMDGAFDAGLCQSADAPEGIKAWPVWQDALMLAIPPRHPLLTYESVPWIRAADYSWIMLESGIYAEYGAQVKSLLHTAGVSPSAVTTVKSFELMMTLVAAGYGLCLAPAARMQGYGALGVTGRPLQGKSSELTTYLLHSGHSDHALLKQLAELLQIQPC